MKRRVFESMQTWDRRSFLKACGVLGVGAVVGGATQSLLDVVRIRRGLVAVSRTRLAMGTYVTMSAVHESKTAAEDAIGRAFEEVERLIGIFSRHDSAAVVSVLNRDGCVTLPPPELVDVLERSLALHAASSGAFDVTVQPVVELYAKGPFGKSYVPPTAREVDEAIARMGIDKLSVTHRRVTLRGGAGITLDGIAKGYIVDRASDTLAAQGIAHHMVNAGGDIRTRGTRDDGNPWSIAIQDPEKGGNYPDIVRLRDGAVATSGDYEIYFDRDKLYHHVVDPRAGSSVSSKASVSVFASTVVEADALSTAVFVMKTSEGLRLIEATPANECLIVDGSGGAVKSSGWRSAPDRMG